MRKLWVSLAILLSALLGPMGRTQSQEVLKQIDLDDGKGAPDSAFGMVLSPDGASLYAAVCGSYYENNHRLVRIDTASDEVADEAETGLFPEEVALKVSGEAVELLFVSNNTDSSITVLRPDLALEKTLFLGAPQTVWPFGLFIAPEDRYLYATTVNQGEVFVIDTEPGPDYLAVTGAYSCGAWNGRLTRYGDRLVIPGGDAALGALLSVIDLADPGPPQQLVLDGNTAGWPMANDVAVTPDGFAYVPVMDFAGSGLLYEVDLTTAPISVSRAIDLNAAPPVLSQEHGICASPDGNTLVVTCFEGTYIKIVGRKAGRVLKAFDANPDDFGWLNEALFSKDGKKLYLSDQQLSLVYVVGGVPQHGLLLDGPQTVALGGTAQLQMAGGEPAELGLLLLSLSLGPITAPTFTMDIGAPFWLIFQAPFDFDSRMDIPEIACPDDPLLSGLVLYFQGLTRDSDHEIRPSNLLTITLE